MKATNFILKTKRYINSVINDAVSRCNTIYKCNLKLPSKVKSILKKLPNIIYLSVYEDGDIKVRIQHDIECILDWHPNDNYVFIMYDYKTYSQCPNKESCIHDNCIETLCSAWRPALYVKELKISQIKQYFTK